MSRKDGGDTCYRLVLRNSPRGGGAGRLPTVAASEGAEKQLKHRCRSNWQLHCGATWTWLVVRFWRFGINDDRGGVNLARTLTSFTEMRDGRNKGVRLGRNRIEGIDHAGVEKID